MTPYWHDDWLTVYQGDCRAVMAEMPAESVHCVVTSPPYWGLRDYGTASWEGGDEGCDHVADPSRTKKFGNPAFNENRPSREETKTEGYYFDKTCGKCGAVRQDAQLGLEPTPEEYVANMVAVFREVRRVLRADGTVWLNLGASYVTAPAGNTTPSGFQQRSAGGQAGALAQWQPDAAGASGRTPSRRRGRAPAYGSDGTEPRGSQDLGSAYSDLCGECRAVLSPHSLGTLRPLPDDAQPPSLIGRDSEPPGSEQAPADALPLDAPASTSSQSSTPPPALCSHCGNCGACLSVLRSSSRDAQECGRKSWLNYPTFKSKDMVPIPWMVAMALQADGWYLRSDIIWSKPNPMPESVTDRPTKSHEYLFLLSKSPRYYFDADAVREAGSENVPWSEASGRGTKVDIVRRDSDSQNALGRPAPTAGRNLRSVWTIATQPYPGAHFATFPRKLVEPCIKAGTSERGVCPECGAPWVRVVKNGAFTATGGSKGDARGSKNPQFTSGMTPGYFEKLTTGWCPTCDRYGNLVHTGADGRVAQPVPATVLDPFAGSGTTALVAQSLGRRAILIDLSTDYLDQIMARNAQMPLSV